MDAAQWPKAALVYDFHKDIGLVNRIEGNGDTAGSNSPSLHSKQGKKKPGLKSDQALNCPRCNSTNTKFCYYNNYNPTQPRYLCKACRRYWTHGGTLRNVPIGGSSRKKIKPSLAPPLSNNGKLFLDLNPKSTTMSSSGNFLATAIPPARSFMHEFNNDLNMGLYYANNAHHHFLPIPPIFELSASHGEALSSYNHVAISSSQTMSEANPGPYYPSSGYHFQDIKPTLNLCMDGGFGGTTTTTTTTTTTNTTHGRRDIDLGRIPYPYGNQMKQDSMTTVPDNNYLDQGNGHTRDSINGHVLYWNNNNHGLYN